MIQTKKKLFLLSLRCNAVMLAFFHIQPEMKGREKNRVKEQKNTYEQGKETDKAASYVYEQRKKETETRFWKQHICPTFSNFRVTV